VIQNRDMMQALESTIMNILVPQKAGNFFTKRVTFQEEACFLLFVTSISAGTLCGTAGMYSVNTNLTHAECMLICTKHVIYQD